MNKELGAMASHHAAPHDMRGQLKETRANRASHPRTTSWGTFARLFDLDCCHWHDDTTVILRGDALRVPGQIRATGAPANCAVTSPPYYGQQDHGVTAANGMERDPQDFIDTLRHCH